MPAESGSSANPDSGVFSLGGIRGRILSVALAPALLIAVAMASVFIHQSLGEGETQRYNQGRLIAQHLAKLAEFSLFVGNIEQLRLMLDFERQNYAAEAIGILDARGQWRVQSGNIALLHSTQPSRVPLAWRSGQHLFFVQPITPQHQADDPYLGDTLHIPRLGQLTLVLSAEPIDALQRKILLDAGLILSLVLAAAGLLAWRMSNSLSCRLQRITRAVGRIAGGALDTRLQTHGESEITHLERGINRMANALETHQSELEGRIQLATAGLLEQKRQAEEAAQAKARFLAAASHDLRQPVHAMSLLVSALKEKTLAADARRLVTHIDSSTSALEALFSALLDLSRLDAGVVEAHPRCIALSDALERIQSQFAPLAESKGLRMRVAATRRHVQADPMLLERILSNLVSNAIRYTDSGGVLVGVRQTQHPDSLRLEVWDTGRGIPAELQDKIFEEYFQVDNPERDRGKGLGLGLAIVSRLARLLGAPRVGVRSQPGHGSCFSLKLPQCHPEAAAPAVDETPVGMPRQALIAVIDDDTTILMAMAELLSAWGLEYAAAANAETLIADLHTARLQPDVILSDYRLRGGHTGIEAIAAVRAAFGASIPAALLTGDTGPEAMQAISASGLPLLHKPLKPAKLRALISHLLQTQA